MDWQPIRDGTKHNRQLCYLRFTEDGVIIQFKNGKVVSELLIGNDKTYSISSKTA